MYNKKKGLEKVMEKQSLTSKIIKILRITNGPISAHAISTTYKISLKKVKSVLTELVDEKLIFVLKTSRGKFYFLPDRYFKRKQDLLDTDEIPPYVWYEDLSAPELEARKRTILEQIDKLKKMFREQAISATTYFTKFQAKNEELAIINQILEDRRKNKRRCFFCGSELPPDKDLCSRCKKQQPHCIVCKQSIFGNEDEVKCPKCNSPAHRIHLIEWLKTIGYCPNCKEKINAEEFIQ